MHFATIVARNFIAHARVLMDSVKAHHPQARRTVLVVDAATSEESRLAPSGVETITLRDLGLDAATLEQMLGCYEVAELCTALKPAMLARLLETGADVAVHLDPDVLVHCPLVEAQRAAREHSIALTPHVLSPIPRDGLETSEATLLRCGMFNLGFIAVSDAAGPFLAWWHERCRRDAIADRDERLLYTDQRWIDFVPSLFPHAILRHPGYNVAYWNLHERQLEARPDGKLRVRFDGGGHDLAFFHFSGFDLDRPARLSGRSAREQRVDVNGLPAVQGLLQDYAARLETAGHRESRAVPYRYDVTAAGLQLTPEHRRTYRSALIRAERRGALPPPSPFAADGGAAFAEWWDARTRRPST